MKMMSKEEKVKSVLTKIKVQKIGKVEEEEVHFGGSIHSKDDRSPICSLFLQHEVVLDSV